MDVMSIYLHKHWRHPMRNVFYIYFVFSSYTFFKQQLIFEEFTQANDSIEKNYGGTGLGLTISKKIVEILGGELSMNSVLGKGSVFEIQLPLLFDTSVLKEIPSVTIPNTGLTAIVIDDDVNLLNLISEVLKQNNYKVLPFQSASKALEIIKNTHFDIVITDIQMPETDGFLFLEELQNLIILLWRHLTPAISMLLKALPFIKL